MGSAFPNMLNKTLQFSSVAFFWENPFFQAFSTSWLQLADPCNHNQLSLIGLQPDSSDLQSAIHNPQWVGPHPAASIQSPEWK